MQRSGIKKKTKINSSINQILLIINFLAQMFQKREDFISVRCLNDMYTLVGIDYFLGKKFSIPNY